MADTDETPEKVEAFLAALAQTCNVTKACKISRVSRATIYRRRDADEEFARKWAEAVKIGGDLLEDEAIRRAHDGVKKPVYQGGRLVGHVQEYSDTLLIFLLKGAKPEKYRDRASVEHTGKDGGPIEVEGARERIARKLAGLAGRSGSGGNPGGPVG